MATISLDGHRITPCPARVLDVLRASDGVVGTWQLVGVIDSRSTTSSTAALRQYVRRLRVELGYDAIKCEWGRGYLLTETGRRVLAERQVCECPACEGVTIHSSDCAVHNPPAQEAGPCTCDLARVA